ncbi:MAG: cysteine desulfurase [Desulfurococcaceae archaeon]
MLNVDEIRKDFPILQTKIRGSNLIYFDNAATTQKPIQVIEAIRRFYSEHNANIHRGLHTLSQKASELYEEAHETVAKFINAYSWDEVVFVKNTTEALNLVAYGWGLKNLGEGDEIIVTIMDHHSSMLPWRIIAQYRGAIVKYVDITNEGYLNYEHLENIVSKRTRVIAFPIASNVLGTINNVKRIVKIARENDAITVADGAQSVPHMPTDVKQLGVDFLAFSGHKMLGPTGIGVLWGRRDRLLEMNPFIVGGDTIKEVTLDDIVWHDLPWRFEGGTPNIAGGVGLAEAVRYLSRIGMDNVREHEVELVQYTFKRFEEIEDIEFYGPRNPIDKTGVVSFNVRDLNHHIVAQALDLFGIAVRSGLHCAHPLHYRLGLKGTVRASYYIYNKIEEIDYFIEVLKSIVRTREVLKNSGISKQICTGT